MRAANKQNILNVGPWSTGPMDFRSIIKSPPSSTPFCRDGTDAYYNCKCGVHRDFHHSVYQGLYQNAPYFTPLTNQTTGAILCKQPARYAVLQEEYEPPDYLFLSILTCLTFCCPIGVCAIMYSCAARDAKKERDFRTAAKFSQKAKQCIIAGIVCGIILIVINVIVIISTPRHCFGGNNC